MTKSNQFFYWMILGYITRLRGGEGGVGFGVH